MATDWLGSIVSINCGESLGVYQGRVSAVDQVSQTISLTRPFHNGVKCLVPEVTFRLVSPTISLPLPGEKHLSSFARLLCTQLVYSSQSVQMLVPVTTSLCWCCVTFLSPFSEETGSTVPV